MIAGDYFITPEAVRRFIERIQPSLNYNQALTAIIKDLSNGDIKGPMLTQNKAAHYIRINGKYQFRAIINEGQGNKKAIVTILRGGKKRYANKG